MKKPRVRKSKLFDRTKISWATHIWNPVTGCTKVSPACDNCYADTLSKRWKAAGLEKYRDGFAVRMHPDELLRTSAKGAKGFKIFVCSMSDLFHHEVSDAFIKQVFEVIEAHPQHIFQLLTKRPERIIKSKLELPANAWLGVTVENQRFANKRIPLLLRIPAAVRFLSIEPILEDIDFGSIPYRGDINYFINAFTSRYSTAPKVWGDRGRPFMFGLAGLGKVDWAILGHESGAKDLIRDPGLEPIRSIVDQCQNTLTAVFIKQLIMDGSLKKELKEFPLDLQIREFPEVI